MKQQRNTRQRALVLEAVMARRDHPTADAIYLDARKSDDKISRGTVYRNLNLLAQNGEIAHIKLPGVDRFDSRLDRHYHMLCLKCGEVSDVPTEYLVSLDEDVRRRTGFAPVRHRLVFEGLCAKCQNAE